MMSSRSSAVGFAGIGAHSSQALDGQLLERAPGLAPAIGCSATAECPNLRRTGGRSWGMPVEPHGYLKKVLAGDETILYVVRQHSLFLWGRIIGAVIAGVLILAAVWALQSYVIDSPQIAWGYLLV